MQNILHISDIHVSESPTTGMSEYALKSFLPSLLEDLKNLPPVDTIFITGDIANSGKASEYAIFTKQFLLPLIKELGVSTSRVLITPGNHDSNRKEWKKSDQLVRSSLITNPLQSSVEEIIREKIGDSSCLWQEDFTNMRNTLDAPPKATLLSNRFFSAYEIDGIGVGCLNSAWLSYEQDKESIFVSEWQFLEIIKALKRFEQKVILMHHPLDWLHPEDKKILMNHIHSSKISCLFYGHMHDFWMTKESLFSEDSILKLQAGRLETSKNDDNCGYSLIALHEPNTFESGEIFFRKFDVKNSKFRSWDERVTNGKASYSLSNTTPYDPDSFSRRCKEIIYEIEFDQLCNTGLPNDQRRKLSELFILPTLAIENGKDITEDSFDAKPKPKPSTQYQTLNSLSDCVESLVILGGENSGKSSLAKRLALHYLTKQVSQNLEHVVYYLDVKGKSFKNLQRINTELLSFYMNNGNEPTYQTKIEKKLNSPSAVVIIDSIENLDTQSLKVMFDYISSSPARFIILGQLSIRTVLRGMTSKATGGKVFQFLIIKALKRSHLKELVNKWKPVSSNTQLNNKIVTHTLKVVSSAGMASNPFVITMLLAIRERKSTSFRTYMHEADLVENFIEVIMQKHVIPSGNVPQYKDVLLFLGYLASHMQANSTYNISHTDLTQKALDFNKLITQDFRSESYLTPILQSGIMRCENDDVFQFSQICFFNYVLANWISKQPTPYLELDNNLNFLRFDKVIEYVSAIKSDPQLLVYLSNRLDDTWKNLIEAERLSDLGNAESEIVKCVSHDIFDMVKDDSLESTFRLKPRTEQEHDDELDKKRPLSDTPIREVKYLPTDISPIVQFHDALSLYARAFRAAEHILDADATYQHFTNVFRHYMNSIAFNVRAFDRDSRPQIIDRIKSILEYEKIEGGKRGEIEAQVNAFINFMIAIIPNWCVVMMSSDFFNQRQRPRIEIHRKQTENNLERILLTYSLCELDDVNILDELKSQKFESRHESSSLIIKLIELIFLNFNIPDHEKEELKKYATKIVKDRKTNQLFKNYTTVSEKMANKLIPHE